MNSTRKTPAKAPQRAAPETAADLGKRLKTAIADVGALFDDPIGVFEDSGVPYSFSQVREIADLDKLDALKKRVSSETTDKANSEKVKNLAFERAEIRARFAAISEMKTLPKPMTDASRSRGKFAFAIAAGVACHRNPKMYTKRERTYSAKAFEDWLKGIADTIEADYLLGMWVALAPPVYM
jgi:hypothetical protein